MCGHTRVAGEHVDEIRRGHAPEPEPEPESGGAGLGKMLPWLLVLGLVAWLGYERLSKKNPTTAETEQPTRRLRLGPQPPTVLVVERERPATPVAPAPVAAVESVEPTPLVQAPEPTAPPLPHLIVTEARNPTQPPESEIEGKKRVGLIEFERDIRDMAGKADQADVAWNRYREGCRKNVTSITAVAVVADRDWLALAGVSVVKTEWTEACAEAGTFFALVGQVRDGVCVAENRARHSWVLPGSRREIRHRYRLDWDGWEGTCSG